MGVWITWFDSNWFNLAQTVGIIGSLGLTFAGYRRDQHARKREDLLNLAGQHRELWSDAHRRPELARIFEPEADLVGNPITVPEREFLCLVIVHFYTGWLVAKDDAILTLDVLATDARGFFSLPLPRTVWELTKKVRDPQFVIFIDNARTSS